MPQGQMIHTETGRIFPEHNEEIARWRWARKVLRAPKAGAGSPGELWLYVHLYPHNRQPLEVYFNGKLLEKVKPNKQLASHLWQWVRVSLPKGVVKAGDNVIELRCDSVAMNAWSLGVENNHKNPKSYLSPDQGKTWRNESMGAHAMLRGEYLIRMRLFNLPAAKAPVVIYEDPTHPRVKEWAAAVPASIRNLKDPWKKAQKLRHWVAGSWTHSSSGQKCYCPWDYFTIKDWSPRKTGHGVNGHISFCVHFGSSMAVMANAIGLKARCIVCTSEVNGMGGHFMTEVWDPTRGKWVIHDPDIDVHYDDGESPKSAFELADLHRQGVKFNDWVQYGPNAPQDNKGIMDALHKLFASGACFENTGIWPRNNFISDTTSAPPSHGVTCYSETEFVWYEAEAGEGTAMFPRQVADRNWFDKAPK